MTKIKMKTDKRGKDNHLGARVKTYEAGKTYDVGISLRKAFVETSGCATDVRSERASKPKAKKAAAKKTTKKSGPTENK